MHLRCSTFWLTTCWLLLGGVATAAEKAETDVPAERAPNTVREKFTPHYLCLCAPYCRKPAPPTPCCCYQGCCGCYCSKPLPCPPSSCMPCRCDDYCPKPLPRCFPCPLCGPRGVCREPSDCPFWIP